MSSGCSASSPELTSRRRFRDSEGCHGRAFPANRVTAMRRAHYGSVWRRPALVVSPGRFHNEDLILCAITSRVPERLSAWEVSLAAGDMAEEELPRTSIIKVSKLFTMHKKLVAARYGTVKEQKLQIVLERLRSLFALEGVTNGAEVAEVAGA